MKTVYPIDKTLPAMPVAEDMPPPPMGHNMPPPEAVLNPPATPDTADDEEFWDAQKVCEYFGGTKPIHLSTLYRGAGSIYPKPINVSVNIVRWSPGECREARRAMMAARNQPKPKPAKPRGRKSGQRIERAADSAPKTKTTTETEGA
jgi:hypothetical protein